MKKKLWTILLFMISVLCLAFGLAACGGNGGKGGNGGNGGDSSDLWTVERLYAEAQAKGFEGSLDDLIALFKGDKGERGVGIKSVEVDEEGHLKVTLTDGTVLDAGKVTADQPAEEGTEGLRYQKIKSEDGEYTVMVTGLGTAWDTDIVIPSTYRGLKVTAIGEYAFSARRGGLLTSITIPDSVISIGNSAFSGCSGLTSITIPDSVTSIGQYTFDGCVGLTSIIIPDSVTSIGDYAFSGCGGLKSITFPSSMISIGIRAFNGCNGLISIAIPNNVAIGAGAFGGCEGLVSATIESETIGEFAFERCSGLTSVTIGSGVKSIGGWAFSGCDSLENVIFVNPNGWARYSYYDDSTLIETFTPEELLLYAVAVLRGGGDVILKRS